MRFDISGARMMLAAAEFGPFFVDLVRGARIHGPPPPLRPKIEIAASSDDSVSRGVPNIGVDDRQTVAQAVSLQACKVWGAFVARRSVCKALNAKWLASLWWSAFFPWKPRRLTG